jgi:hypothetical protein
LLQAAQIFQQFFKELSSPNLKSNPATHNLIDMISALLHDPKFEEFANYQLQSTGNAFTNYKIISIAAEFLDFSIIYVKSNLIYRFNHRKIKN